MERGYVLRRVMVLSEASMWQETSLETTQRETYSSYSYLDSNLSRWWSHGVGRDFSDSFIENLTAQRYISEVFTPHVLPFLCQMPVTNIIFKDDNARPHQACIIDDFLRTNNVNRMDWPAMSPDLSCIGCSRKSCFGTSGAQQHTAGSSAVPERRMGPNSTTDHPETRVLFKEQSVNAGIITVVTHPIEHY